MQDKDKRLLEIIHLNISALKNDLYNYKSYIDQMESAIRELKISSQDTDCLFELWSNLEIIYSVMAYEQRTIFNSEELEGITYSLDEMNKIINKLLGNSSRH